MKRTAQQLYDYESKRADKYRTEFQEILNEQKVDIDTWERLSVLFEWYGHARAIKSKAYQDMKAKVK